MIFTNRLEGVVSDTCPYIMPKIHFLKLNCSKVRLKHTNILLYFFSVTRAYWKILVKYKHLSTKILLFGLLIVIALLQTNCANTKTPTGGPKDETPPQIDSSEYFTPNLSTNFSATEIVLPFDEWVVLNDVFKQVVISPPLENPVNMSLKKRTVILDFSKETLRQNTTYTINFGESIKDLTEGNFQKNFRYIFSTGPFIDSLELSGSVRDALTDKAIENVLVILYDNLEDSVVFKERPYYFGRTDKSGKFTIPYVKSDTFKVFALLEKNLNYLFDSPNEQIGFLDTAIIMHDSMNTKIDLRLFNQSPPLRLFKPKSPHYGWIKFVFNHSETEFVNIEPQAPLLYSTARQDDTIHLWYANQIIDSMTFVLSDTANFRDTINIRLADKNSLDKQQLTAQTSKAAVQQNPDKPLILSFNHPIQSIDTGQIFLLQDTLQQRVQPNIQIDSLDPRQLIFNYAWQEGKIYQLFLFDSAAIAPYGIANDTIQAVYKVQERKNLGNVIVNVTGMNPNKQYVVELLDKNDNVVEALVAPQDTAFTQKLLSVKATDYKLRVIEDINKNGKWDTGNYPHQQPEPIVISPATTNLRKNWELDLKIALLSAQQPIETIETEDGEKE